ncbi:MAG: hypothetical protein LBR71_04935, partial [Synergistaceae bacterium]|nr:hypothetical protein [Synergistaceae bacterium]
MVHLGKRNNEVGTIPSTTTNTTTSAGIYGVSTRNLPTGDYQVTKADLGERRSIHFEPFKSAAARHIAPLDHAALTVQDYRSWLHVQPAGDITEDYELVLRACGDSSDDGKLPLF